MTDEMLNTQIDKSLLVSQPKSSLCSEEIYKDIMLTQEEMDILPFKESSIRLKVKTTIQKNAVIVKEEFRSVNYLLILN